MPTGLYIRRKREENFVKEYPTPISSKATEWLANIEHTEDIHIQHARNGAEYQVGIKKIPVDGYCELVYLYIDVAL